MQNLSIEIVNKSNNPLPKYQTGQSAGLDLHAWLDEPVELKPGERTMIKTGLYLSLPAGYEAQIRPRSGLAFKQGITVINSPGTIDADYRGEIGIVLINHGQDSFAIKSGDRIAQMVIAKHEQALWNEVDSLDETARGTGGYGSSGI
jgi:dUTP pyrophosphatase